MSDNPTISLVADNLRALFWPDAGMLCTSLRFHEEELLRRVEDLETARQKGSTAGIPLLYPWANRLASLHYQAAGRDVVLNSTSPVLHFDDHGLPIHGVPWGKLQWKVLEAKPDSLLARLDWHRQELLAVFPFPHSVQLAAQIAPNSLTLHTTVYANAESRVPVSFGFHPYFGIPHVERSKWRLQLPSLHQLQLDAHGIPTGVSQVFGPFDRALDDSSFDDGFALDRDDASLVVSGAGYKITVSFLQGFPYAQVFAPKGRDFIALEPMTAPTNALVSGKGLRVLEPGEQLEASFRVAVDFSA